MAEPLVIRCRENGPFLIQGPVKILDHQGKELVPPPGKETIALCRCGQSKIKPFCDGSHKTCGFQSAELAGSEEGFK
ncbi:MAG: CDGSH iron-sulfur domain-containing protein [Gemmataceae bacterium]